MDCGTRQVIKADFTTLNYTGRGQCSYNRKKLNPPYYFSLTRLSLIIRDKPHDFSESRRFLATLKKIKKRRNFIRYKARFGKAISRA